METIKLKRTNTVISKDLACAPGYKILNIGLIIDPNGEVVKHHLTGGKKGKRYKRVYINKQYVYIHRLMAETFLEKTADYVDHKNGLTTDNHIDNLRWVSQSENTKGCKKEKYVSVSDNDVAEMFIYYNTGDYKVSKIAEMFGYKDYTI
jgi:hypothetical protein